MKQRIYWIDNLRAIAMLSMIVYHTVWDLVWLYGMEWQWYHGIFAKIWQQSICWTFILLSGFCWSFSKNHLKQGLLVSAGGLTVTAVTLFFSYQSRIIFGVLSLIGVSALLLIPLKKLFERIPPWYGFFIMMLCMSVTYGINEGYLGIFGWRLFELPECLYANLLTTFLGFPPRTFFSADYFPILPWTFLYFSGYFLCRLWKEEKIPGADCLDRRVPFLTAFGKKSFLVYLLHQPIIYFFLQLIFCG